MNITIGKRKVGLGYPVYIIFEIASTHSNNWNLITNYIKQAKESGADALKLQLFKADKLLNPISSLLKPTYDYFKTAETPKEWLPKLKKLCDSTGIDLLCTPFDPESATFLHQIGLTAVKIASGDLTNHQLLVHVAKFNKPVILSTGMSTMNEVAQSVGVLKNAGCKDLAILQCTSVYPMPYEDANIKAMNTIGKTFETIVGYSDNGSKGILVPLVAVAKGASIIEKHVTSQKERGNMDDIFSLSIKEFTEMVKKIRQLEQEYQGLLNQAVVYLKNQYGKLDVAKILGNSEKKPAEHGYIRENSIRFTEADERYWARRGVYPKRDIKKGTKITEEMLILLRPDVGVSANHFQDAVGSYAIEDLKTKNPLFLRNNRIRVFRKSDIYLTYGKENQEFAKILSETALF